VGTLGFTQPNTCDQAAALPVAEDFTPWRLAFLPATPPIADRMLGMSLITWAIKDLCVIERLATYRADVERRCRIRTTLAADPVLVRSKIAGRVALARFSGAAFRRLAWNTVHECGLATPMRWPTRPTLCYPYPTRLPGPVLVGHLAAQKRYTRHAARSSREATALPSGMISLLSAMCCPHSSRPASQCKNPYFGRRLDEILEPNACLDETSNPTPSSCFLTRPCGLAEAQSHRGIPDGLATVGMASTGRDGWLAPTACASMRTAFCWQSLRNHRSGGGCLPPGARCGHCRGLCHWDLRARRPARLLRIRAAPARCRRPASTDYDRFTAVSARRSCCGATAAVRSQRVSLSRLTRGAARRCAHPRAESSSICSSAVIVTRTSRRPLHVTARRRPSARR